MRSSIFVVPMTGAAIAIDNASAADTILTVKKCVRAANRMLPVRRQRLVYIDGPYGLDALADDETLGGAGVAQDGTAKLDVLLDELTEAQFAELSQMVWRRWMHSVWHCLNRIHRHSINYNILCRRPHRAVAEPSHV